MHIERLKLRDFRNYENAELEFSPLTNVIYGDNAQGKTNILEAVYLTALGKSFRTARDAEMIRFGSEFLKVKAIAQKYDEDLTVELVIADKGKGAKIDGIKIKKISELFDNIYTVIFSPEDLKIVKDDPEKRRKFIDTELCLISPSYYANISSYKRVLKQRNAFLKECRITGKTADRNVLSVWDEQLAAAGAAMIMKRNIFIEKLKIISGEIHSGITSGREILNVIYEPSVAVKENFEKQKNYFKEKLEKNFAADSRSGNTGIGPHRDDMCITVNGTDIRKFGSQGQQRTAALSLKLAEIKLIKEETGENAVLLLDDVMSELDASRQNFLISSLDDIQLFITTTDLTEDVKNALPDGYMFRVEKGQCKLYNSGI